MIKLDDFNEDIRVAEMLSSCQSELLRTRQEVIITAIRAILREREIQQ